jgi:integral membrane sensor domain MASE1
MLKDDQNPSSLFLSANASTQFYVLILQIIGLASAYFVTGKLGIYLAIPPGYATAIWPSSGIALVAILLGYRVWPGILIGSFWVNIPTALDANSLLEILTSAGITLAIGGGANFQALVGAYLVRRYTSFPNLLCSEKEVFLFFVYGGLLSALVNSTIAVSLLVAIAQIPATKFLRNWVTWWMGDVLGILIFTPLFWSGRNILVILGVIDGYL